MTTAGVLAEPIDRPVPGTAPRYRPGLDGLRAISVALVVVFHLGGINGGNLGVDAFFVISGWLITWRLLAEYDGTGRIALTHFWAARMRRLMPASLTVIAAVVVTWPLLGIEVASLRRDALFATFWASNWGTISGGGDYWARFGEVSPLTHFWSLAIEEQFYLVWPLLLVGVLLVARRRRISPRTAISTTAVVVAAASVVFMLISFDPADRTGTYMNTFARAHTLLIGAAAGAFTLDRGTSLRGAAVARRAAPVAALVALLVVAVSSEQSDWLYRWGFPLFAVAAMVVVVAVADGLWNRVLAAAPMRWVGDRSYAIYLWHWPVIVLLDETRVHLDGLPLAILRVIVSVGLAHLSFTFVEQPVRRRRRLAGRRAPLAAAGAMIAIVIVAITVVPAAPSSDAMVVSLAVPASTVGTAAPTTVPASTVPATTVPATTVPASIAPSTTRPPLPALRVLMVGDSTAVHLAEALLPYSADHSDEVLVGSAAFPGCGLSAFDDGRLHEMTDQSGRESMIDLSACVSEWESIPRRVATERYDVVLVSIGPWDGTDIEMADGRVVSVADEAGAEMIARAYRAFVGQVEATGARVVWITPPDVDLEWKRVRSPMDDPSRWQALRAIIDELPVEQIDLPRWLTTSGNDGSVGRPDGVHLSAEAAIDFVRDVVVPQLVAITRG